MFINITKEISVNHEHIVALESLSDLSCIVHTDTKSFLAQMSKSVIMDMMKKAYSENTTNKILEGIARGQTTPTP